jgi:hypothetical protein
VRVAAGFEEVVVRAEAPAELLRHRSQHGLQGGGSAILPDDVARSTLARSYDEHI